MKMKYSVSFYDRRPPSGRPLIYVKLTTRVCSPRRSKSCKVIFSINLSHVFVAITYAVVIPRLDFFQNFFALILVSPFASLGGWVNVFSVFWCYFNCIAS